jgi:hypothetical protein
MKSSTALALFALVIAPWVAPVSIAAQTPTCAQAQTTVNSNEGYSRDQIAMAWYVMVTCGDAAPAAIVSAIRRATLNTGRDTLALLAAWSLADRRLVDSIIVLAKDPSQVNARRWQYLGLLTRYYDPSLTLDLSARGPGGGIALAVATDAKTWGGNQPIDQAARDRAKAAIAWMGANDPSLELRRMAALVAQQLATLTQ